MTNHAVLIGLLIFFAAAAAFVLLHSKGEQLVNRNKPKPDLADPAKWTIGPIVNGENDSVNMPLHPGPGMLIDFATPSSEPHYVTVDYGSLAGKTRIIMRFKYEGGPILSRDGTAPATVCLYVQRVFDDWRAIDSDPYKDSDTESYRWFATPNSVTLTAPGEYEIIASNSDLWTALIYSESQGAPPKGKPEAFKKAWDNANAVGFVFGGGTSDTAGWGHGAKAQQPAKITITIFDVG